MKIKNCVIHPILFSIYPILFFYSHNMGEIYLKSVTKPVVITLALVVLAWWLLRVIFKGLHRSGAVVSWIVLLFFSYGHVKSSIPFSIADYIFLLMWVGVLLAGSLIIGKTSHTFTNTTKILNVGSLVLIALVIANISIFQMTSRVSQHEIPIINPLDKSLKSNVEHDYPDIYFIVLDAYAREDVLRDIYDFDNSDFLGFLEKKGFYIADKAISNYNQTGLSLASCLNLNYLDVWVKKIGEGNQNRRPVNLIYTQNHAVEFLKKRGYEVITFASTSTETELKNADLVLDSGIVVNQFYSGLINTTPLPDMGNQMRADDVFTRYRHHVSFIFNNLGKIESNPGRPKFVFAHIPIPHPPFLFDQNGGAVQLEAIFNDHDGNWLIRQGRLSEEQYHEHYRNQVRFTNMQMQRTVTEILDNSTKPPIIFILGDHGPRSRLNWESGSETDVRESLTILSAYHFPDNGQQVLYPEISPVNSFRVMFNQYFGTDMNLLPDLSFYSTAQYLYKFEDVTDRVNAEVVD